MTVFQKWYLEAHVAVACDLGRTGPLRGYRSVSLEDGVITLYGIVGD
jgi:hypothetical protein